MRSHLLEEPEAFDNFVVELNKFSLTQSVHIDLCHLVAASAMVQWGSMY
jgi:hypothetical protein